MDVLFFSTFIFISVLLTHINRKYKLGLGNDSEDVFTAHTNSWAPRGESIAGMRTPFHRAAALSRNTSAGKYRDEPTHQRAGYFYLKERRRGAETTEML